MTVYVTGDVLAPPGLHEAESTAVATDLEAADFHLEMAVRAANTGQATAELAAAGCWLRNAQTVYAYNGDSNQADEVADAASQIERWVAAGLPTDPAGLAEWQTQVGYQFHAVIGRLFGMEASREGHDGAVVFLGLVIMGGVIWGSMSYESRHQRRG